jgi:hypothetical protein
MFTDRHSTHFSDSVRLAVAEAPHSSICIALLHQPGDELSVGVPGLNWMTGLNMTIGVVGIVVQQEIGCVSVKDGNNFTFDVPLAQVTGE